MIVPQDVVYVEKIVNPPHKYRDYQKTTYIYYLDKYNVDDFLLEVSLYLMIHRKIRKMIQDFKFLMNGHRMETFLEYNAMCHVCRKRAEYVAPIMKFIDSKPDYCVTYFQFYSGSNSVPYVFSIHKSTKTKIRKVFCQGCLSQKRGHGLADKLRGSLRNIVREYTLEQGMELLQSSTRQLYVRNHSISLRSPMLRYISSLSIDQLACKLCGARAEKFIVFRRGADRVFQLYTSDSRFGRTILGIDHIVPMSRGGERDNWENFQLVCDPCNVAKGSNIDIGE